MAQRVRWGGKTRAEVQTCCPRAPLVERRPTFPQMPAINLTWVVMKKKAERKAEDERDRLDEALVKVVLTHQHFSDHNLLRPSRRRFVFPNCRFDGREYRETTSTGVSVLSERCPLAWSIPSQNVTWSSVNLLSVINASIAGMIVTKLWSRGLNGLTRDHRSTGYLM